MKKVRSALFGLICMAGLLSACGESPMAPSADVPLMGAEAGWKSNDGSGQKNDQNSETTNTDSELKDINSTTESMRGYVLGME